MTPFYYSYIACWSIACLVAFSLLICNRSSMLLFTCEYRNLVFAPWKLITFCIALAAFVVLAPYTGDPTWDYYDATFMSILTYLTAPWSVGILYRFARRMEKFYMVYIAVCIWMFSASWSYDIYLVFRDGYYPNTWWTNIFASSVLYLSAGMFWNLEYRPGRGVIFSFMDNGWPATYQRGGFGRLFLYALPFMVIAAGVFVPFLL